MNTTASYIVGVRINGDARGLSRAAQEGLRSQRLLAGGSVREYQRMATARAQLGVRSEREVRREIQQTEAAYNRLARSGALSWQEQRMAAKAMREEVTRLTNEMGRLTTRQKVAMGFKATAALGAGVGVAAAIAAPKVQQAMDFDLRMAYLANTAFNSRDNAGWRAGLAEVKAMVIEAARQGGGTRENAAATAEALFGAGVFEPDQIKAILREAVMAGTASGADSAAFAQMAITGKQTFGIDAAKMDRLFGIGTYGGQVGGFEIRDMARWLPQQMAAAKAVGMSGEKDFAKLVALNQAAVTTAGTKDEAGNNVVNLLAKLGSQDTVKDFQKQGVNLPKELAEGRMRGLDALDVVGNLLQAQLAKDKNYQQVQRQLAMAKSDAERTAALESVGNIAQGTAIGKVFQDRQALMGLYGFVNQRDRVNTIAADSLQRTGAAKTNFDRIASTAAFNTQQVRSEKDNAIQTMVDKLSPSLAELNKQLTELMRQYPTYTAAVIGFTGALGALAATLGGLALLGGRLPGKGGPLMPPKAPRTTPFPKIEGAAPAAGAGVRGMLGRLGTVGMVATLGADLFMTSDEDVAILKAAAQRERDEAAKAIGVRQRMSPTGASSFAPSSYAPNGSGGFTYTAPPGATSTGGYRGAGFVDPRIVARKPDDAPQGFAQRLGNGKPAVADRQELKGEITVRVSAAPGLNLQAETKSATPGVTIRADVGSSMRGAGH